MQQSLKAHPARQPISLQRLTNTCRLLSPLAHRQQGDAAPSVRGWVAERHSTPGAVRPHPSALMAQKLTSGPYWRSPNGDPKHLTALNTNDFQLRLAGGPGAGHGRHGP